LELLYYASDLWDLPSPEQPGPNGRSSSGRGQDPLSGYIGERVDDRAARISCAVFLEAVEALKRERWHLYVRLRPLYFDENPNPERLNAWKGEAKEDDRDTLDAPQTKLRHHEEAVAFMLEYIERRLAGYGLDRLRVSLPLRVRGERARRTARRRRRAVEVLCEELGRGRPRAEAIKAAHARIAAEGEPYSLKEMRVMARDIEGRASRREREEIRRESG